MERRIGEIFEYQDKILRVKEAEGKICEGCVFLNKCSREIKWSVGCCSCGTRSDKKNVIFVEVKEQQEPEAVKERKIGETFKYDGKTLEVVETKSETCHQCWLKENNGRCTRIKSKTGECGMIERSDRRPVIFVEVKDKNKEQPHQTEPQPNLNLCEILKDCPKGTELWSDNYGIVKFMSLNIETDHPIQVLISNGQLAYYTKEGWWNKNFPASCLLYPSKDCRDWSKFSAPWYKKEKFDPKTLKAFDRVLVRNYTTDYWCCGFFSYISMFNGTPYKYVTENSAYWKCIPYNDDTKHLVGTKEEAPDFYRYWND